MYLVVVLEREREEERKGKVERVERKKQTLRGKMIIVSLYDMLPYVQLLGHISIDVSHRSLHQYFPSIILIALALRTKLKQIDNMWDEIDTKKC